MQLVCHTYGRKSRMPDQRLKDDRPCGSRVIRFAKKGRRKVQIPDVTALAAFAQAA